MQVGEWPFCPHGFPSIAVIDDQIEGGPRMFETLGHEEVWIESKSQLKRVAEERGYIPCSRHDANWHAKNRRAHMEKLRDTGQLR